MWIQTVLEKYPMPHPEFAERWPLWGTGDEIGCEPGATGKRSAGQGIHGILGFLENWTSGFLRQEMAHTPTNSRQLVGPRVGGCVFHNSMIQI